MRINSVCAALARIVVLTGMGTCSLATAGHGNVQAQAQEKIAQALATALNEAQRATLEHKITVRSPRGAALNPCPSAWQWEAVDLRHWKRVHIGVRCEGVAGSLVGQVHARAPVWTLARTLPKGHHLQAQDLEQQIRAVDSLQHLIDQTRLLQMQLRKPLRAGATVQAQDLQRAVFARRGETVEIRASLDGITVSTKGLAERTAYQGETLRVRNLRSQQWVTGRLIAPGVLEASDQPSGGVKVQVQSPG